MSEARAVLLAAGGTGGHLFPAQALAVALARRGVAVELATDKRALKYGGSFPARAIHAIPSATPTGGSILSKVRAALSLALGTLAARRLIARLKPYAVVGFGGYPTVPPVLAASMARVPAIIHEQNAVMGRANRFLAGRVAGIATGFSELGRIDPSLRARLRHIGNPLRPEVIEAAGLAYPVSQDGALHILVTGGSQGARVMADVVPPAVALLNAEERARLRIVQQARGEDEARVREAYAQAGVIAEVAPFFSDLPQRIAQAQFVIARSGASTVSELAVIGRACILVPFPHALDQDQAANAGVLAATGAAHILPQVEFTPQRLAEALRAALVHPQDLQSRAEAARKAGIPDAADRLADYVIATARIPVSPEQKS